MSSADQERVGIKRLSYRVGAIYARSCWRRGAFFEVIAAFTTTANSPWSAAMNQNKEQLLNNLRDSLTRYKKMKEEASDPIALRFLADIVEDLEAEVALLKVDSQERRTGL